jgi:hypothetical protein
MVEMGDCNERGKRVVKKRRGDSTACDSERQKGAKKKEKIFSGCNPSPNPLPKGIGGGFLTPAELRGWFSTTTSGRRRRRASTTANTGHFRRGEGEGVDGDRPVICPRNSLCLARLPHRMRMTIKKDPQNRMRTMTMTKSEKQGKNDRNTPVGK